ncbi:hypothetical protein HDU97_004127 [Phlyctochytrium planicorne]|nr:hypothetical protein HDU97_004127 [Phlyctochytrium planicorne]
MSSALMMQMMMMNASSSIADACMSQSMLLSSTSNNLPGLDSSASSSASSSAQSSSSSAFFSSAASASSSSAASSSSSSSSPIRFQFFSWELSLAEVCMILLPIAIYWVYSTVLYCLSMAKITSLELHRIPTDQKRRPKNRVTVKEVLVSVALQHIVQAMVALVVVVYTRPDGGLDWKMEAPWLVLVKFMVATVILDTYQYWMHRWAHKVPFLYRNFHSVHHRLTAPYAYGALYNHPVEGFLMDTIGGAIPSLLLDMHPWTSCIFYSIATFKTVDDHCGFAWPYSPFKLLGDNDAAYHDVHHWGKGIKYNFSQPFYTFWDRLMGTEFVGGLERLKREEEEREAAKLAKEVEKKVEVEEEEEKVDSANELDQPEEAVGIRKRNNAGAAVAGAVVTAQ